MVDEYAAAYRCSQSLIPSAPAAVPDTAPATR
jgi:hypothetical protein